LPLAQGARGAAAGEIIPQALCTRYGLQIGAYSAWFVRGLMALTSPLTFPISKILDCLLGTEHGVRMP
jgi:metal transporter CNNM